VEYISNVSKADHCELRRLIRTTLRFKSLKIAYAALKGFEVVRALKRQQARASQIQDGIQGEVRLVGRAFGFGIMALAEVVAQLHACLRALAFAGTCKNSGSFFSNAENLCSRAQGHFFRIPKRA